jgi:C4-type Zn-finger protein
LRAILIKPLKNKNKVITGMVLSNTFDKLTLVVIDNKGNSRIKSFKKEQYSITYEN